MGCLSKLHATVVGALSCNSAERGGLLVDFRRPHAFRRVEACRTMILFRDHSRRVW